jgi:hypothetical protein
MLLLKRTSAWDELSNLVERDEDMETSSPYFKLYDAILEADKTDALDNVISDEFPNGVEIDELEDFFKDEQDFILEELGIDQSSTDDYYDDDEDGSEEEDYDYDNDNNED